MVSAVINKIWSLPAGNLIEKFLNYLLLWRRQTIDI